MRAQNVSAKSVRAKVRQLRHPLYYLQCCIVSCVCKYRMVSSAITELY